MDEEAPLDDGDLGLDQRNAVLLVESKRRHFLANLAPGIANSYATLYAQARRYIAHCDMMIQKAASEEEREKWRLMRAWPVETIQWLDENLEMTSSTGGKRSAQLVQAITAEQARMLGPEAFLQMTGASPAKQPEKKGWLFKR